MELRVKTVTYFRSIEKTANEVAASQEKLQQEADRMRGLTTGSSGGKSPAANGVGR